jgi:hypothetical protein
MSVGTATALTIAGISAAGAVGSSLIGANAASSAANEQAQSADNALAFNQQVFNTNQANQAPFVGAGTTAISQLMGDLNNGTFGPGSNPTFTAPTLDQARATPGYAFTLQQGERAVDAGAAASGGALSGGNIKSETQYATGLADSTYNDVFSRQLSSYQANLSNQAQEFNQLYQPASLGENAAANVGNTSTAQGQNIGNLMTSVGNAQAAGTIGVANATAGGINGVATSATQALLLNQLGLGGGSFAGGTGGGVQYDTTGAPIAGTGTDQASIDAQLAAGF